MANFKKPVAVITGASTGIGRDLSIKLSDDYFIYLISRNKDKLQKTANLILGKGNECKYIEADISSKEALDYISSKIQDKDNVELLINNAGVAIFNDISNLSINDWNRQLNVNLFGSFLMTKIVIDSMKSKKRGTIVFTNSIAGLHPYKNSTAYVASKYGLRGFSSSLREELRDYNIKIISIHPGAINTPLWDNMGMDQLREEMMDVSNVSDMIISAIKSPDNCVVEELVIRRIAGDF